jgi:phenylalanyl-tRNA synthetase beta chain
MPTIEVDYGDFQRLLGVKISRDPEELDEILSYAKGELKLLDDEKIHIEIGDSNRPDLWGVEGLARALRGYLGVETGLKEYAVTAESGVEVHVDPRLEKTRPYIACAVVKNVQLSDVAIRALMNLQDKLDQTYGRNRKRTSIGLYNFNMVAPPLRYSVAKPKEISFVPLGFTEKLTLEEILEKHPKGVEYGHLVKEYEHWPIFIDSKNQVLSFPPIINSNDLGRLTEETSDVLVEVTGTVHKTILNTLNAVVLALADRGGTIYSTKIHYPYGGQKEVVTPKLESHTMPLDLDYVNAVLGLKLNPKEAVELLEKARYGFVKSEKSVLTVRIPCYRVDIMHPIDIVEDIAIAYGYDNIEPNWRRLPTVGGITPEHEFCDVVREIMIGLGFQEVLTYTLTNSENLFAKMNLKKGKKVEIANPRILTMTCLRSWLLPSLMEFLSHNVHVDYPQKIFEVGYAVIPHEGTENRTRDILKLACAIAHPNASFTEAKAVLDALFLNLGKQFELEESSHPSFIDGRVGNILVEGKSVGFIGEIHPKVLEAWKIENPAAAIEIDLEKIMAKTH